MYLLYLDDSGSIDNANEEYFVLGGVCLHERSIQWQSNQLDDLAANYHGSDPGLVEFHASEVFSGRTPPWNQFKKREDRVEIIKKVLLTLRDAFQDTVLFACAIHKKSFPSADPLAMAFEDLCNRFDMYLNRISQEVGYHKGFIIIDKSAYAGSLQKLALDFRRQGTKWRNLRNIREVPFFVDSRASRLIQLADHIAYSVFRRYNAQDLTYYNCIEDRFDSDQGVVHGLVHRQTVKYNCTCPACLTRR